MSIRDDYSDADWDKLTKEEQEGLLLMDTDPDENELAEGETTPDIDGEGGEGGEGEAAGMSDLDRLAANDRKAAALAEQQKEEAGEGGEGGEGAGEGEAAAAAAAAAEPDAAAKEAAEAAENAKLIDLPKGWNAQLPEDYETRVQANEDAQTANTKAYDDGDISFAEYTKEQRKLDRESRSIEKEKDTIELDRKLASESVMGRWQGVMSAFLPQHPELNTTTFRGEAFDTILKRVTAETLNKGKIPGLADAEKAYKEWCTEFNVEPTNVTAQKKATVPAKKEKVKTKVPPTLGGLPAAQATDTQDGRFAQLDRMTGEKYEEALAKLSSAERDAYLQYAS